MHTLRFALHSLFALLSLILFPYNLHGNCGGHSTHHTSNEFVPTLRLDLPPIIFSENSAASMFGEFGRRNFRASGTFGFYIYPSARMKFTGEFLREKLGFNFTTGKVHKWLGQYAVGTQIEYLFPCFYFFKSVDIGGYYSRSQSKHLSTITCPITSEGIPNHHRHIAGSNASFFSAGLTVIPWCDATLRLAADYDFLKYRRTNKHDRRAFNGGGTIEFSQVLFRDFTLNLIGEIRSPFDYIGGDLNWKACTPYGIALIGIFGGYTRGKEHLPDSVVAGIEVGIGLEGIRASTPCCISDPCCPWAPLASPSVNRCDLLAWVAKPAVYVPQVLVIADGKKENQCLAPTSTTIPTQTIADDVTNYTINIAPFFSNPEGTAFTFSAQGLPNGDGYTASINSSTGVISGVNAQLVNVTFHVTVTATSACGSATQSFDLTLLAPST